MSYETVAPILYENFSEEEIEGFFDRMTNTSDPPVEQTPTRQQVLTIGLSWKVKFRNINGIEDLAQVTGLSIKTIKEVIMQIERAYAQWKSEQEGSSTPDDFIDNAIGGEDE